MIKKILFIASLFSCILFSQIADAAIQPTPKHISLDGVFTTDLGIQGNSASSDDGVAIITSSNINQVGAVWSTSINQLDFKKDFNAVAYVNQGDSGSSASDGMVFVLQGTSNQMKWFTHSGASMGALGENKYEGTLGIPNSIGIEFDLYGNHSSMDGYFDYGISSPYNNNHVAIVYPGTKDGYKDNWSILGSSRYVVHNNVITDIDLAYGNWTRFELDWKTNLENYTKGILKVKIKNADPIQISPEYLKSQVFQNGTVSTAYWGFTGSTGPKYKAKQQVVFEKIPGLVEADTSLFLQDAKGAVFRNGDTVKGGSSLTVNMNAKWLHGKQNWQGIIAEASIPSSLKRIPNTTKINGQPVADNIWSLNNLLTQQGNIPDIGTYGGISTVEVKITFDVEVINESVINQAISHNFSGRNAINDTDYFTFNVEKQFLKAMITSPSEGVAFLADELDSLKLDFLWLNPQRKTISQTVGYKQKNVSNFLHISDNEDGSAGEGTLTYEFVEKFNELDYGEIEILYNLQGNGEQDNSLIRLYKQFRPKITVKEQQEKLSYQIGEKIPIQMTIEDKDSIKEFVYIQIDDNEVINVGEFSNDTSVIKKIDYAVPTDNLASGYHKISAYVIDSEGNKSFIASLENVAIEGALKLVSFPTNFHQLGLKIGGAPTKINNFGKISISDQRVLARDWSLSANLVEGRFTTLSKNLNKRINASEDFFVYNDGEKEIPIARDIACLVKSSGIYSMEEVILNQDGENGFYFKPNNGMVEGDYQATVNWILSAAPE